MRFWIIAAVYTMMQAIGWVQPEVAPLPISQELDPSRLLVFAEKGSSTERLQAINRLGQLRRSEAIPALIPFLSDPVADIREATANAVGRICAWRDPVDDSAVTPLIGLLADDTSKVRTAAANALGQVRSPLAADNLATVMTADKDISVRRVAAIALADLNDSRAYAPLLEMMKTADRVVKMQVVEALCTKDDPKVINALVTLLTEPDSNMRKTILHRLVHGEFPDLIRAVCTTLTDPSPEVRKLAADYLRIQHDTSSVPALLVALEDADPQVADTAAEAFAWSGELQHEGINGLLEALKSKKASARAAALQALYKSSDQRVSAAVMPCLNDADQNVRQAAICTLGSIANPQVLEPLIAMLQSTEAKKRAAAATALGDLKRKEAVAPLLPLLKDKDFNVRWAAVKALRSIHDPSSVDALIEVLADEQPMVRESAVRALAVCRAQKAVPILLAMLQTEKEDFVQTSLIQAFRSIRDERCITPILALYPNTHQYTRAACLYTLASYPGEQAKDLIIDALKSNDAFCQNTALQIASSSRMTDPRLADLMLTILQNPKADGSLLTMVAWKLVAMHDQRIIKPVKNLLTTTKDSWLKGQLMRVLSILGDETAIPVIQQFANDPDPQVALYAHGALLRLRQMKSLDYLLTVMNGKNQMLSSIALQELSSSTQPRALAVLLEMLLDPQSPRRVEAAFSLMLKIKPEMLDPLLAMANGNDPEERKLAALALAGNENPRTLAVQQCLLREGKEALPTKIANSWIVPSLLLFAATAMAKQDDPAGMEYLIDQINNFDDNSRNIPDQAADALARITGQDFRLDGEQWEAWWKKNQSVNKVNLNN